MHSDAQLIDMILGPAAPSPAPDSGAKSAAAQEPIAESLTDGEVDTLLSTPPSTYSKARRALREYCAVLEMGASVVGR